MTHLMLHVDGLAPARVRRVAAAGNGRSLVAFLDATDEDGKPVTWSVPNSALSEPERLPSR